MAETKQQNRDDGNTNAQGKRKPGWMAIKGGPKEPNFQDFHGKLQVLSADKSKCFDQLSAIREKLDGAKEGEDDSVRSERKRLQGRMMEIRDERKKLNGMKEDKFSERQGLQNERKALQRQISDFSDELSGFDSLEAIEGAIDRVLIHMETGSGSLKSEKKTLKRVTQLEKAKAMVQELRLLEERNQDAANEDRELGQEYTRIRQDIANLDSQFKSVAQEKDAAQKKEKGSFDGREKIKEERTKIRAEIDGTNEKITALRKSFDDSKAAWNTWREEAQKIWQAERDAQQAEWEKKKAEREVQYKANKKAAKAAKRLNPYRAEIDASTSLIRFLNDKLTAHAADKERAEREKKLAEFNAAATAPKGFTVKQDEEDQWAFADRTKKQQKQKAPKAKKAETKVEEKKAPAKSHSEKAVTFSQERRQSFDTCKLDPPQTYAEIPAIIKLLQDKKAEFESHIKVNDDSDLDTTDDEAEEKAEEKAEEATNNEEEEAKDEADKTADDYEKTHHEKSGGGHDKHTPSGQSKPVSVRTE